MPLSKVKVGSNMYQDWISHTHTHLGGECPHECKYCYVKATAKRFGGSRYQGELCMVEKELAVKYGAGRTIFIEHCNDMWAESVPIAWVRSILDHCSQYPDNEYVFQTKSPAMYDKYLDFLPPRRILGCTIESDNDDVVSSVSNAPRPFARYAAMKRLSNAGERLFVTIEPILRCDTLRITEWMVNVQPEFVNIGADSKGTGLPEPSADDVRLLIRSLQDGGVEIRQKSNLDRLLKEKP